MTGVVAVDTSVAVPLLVRPHPAHESTRQWGRDKSLRLAGHAALETYSVLSRLPGDLAVDPATAHALIDGLFAEPLTLDAPAQRSAVALLAAHGVAGGAVYDGLVALAALAHGVLLATRDRRALGTYQRLDVHTVTVT
ncbi:MAG: type II toxin-antitoxin system VapC family toxin [Kineosporiaceae bacterium]